MRCLCLQVILFASTAIGTSYLQGQISETEGKCSGSRGKVAAIHDDSVAVKNDDGALVFRVNADTKIWRGSSIRLNQLHLGDDVIVQCVTNQSGGLPRRIYWLTSLGGRERLQQSIPAVS